MINAARKAARGLQRDFGEVENLQVSLKGPANFVTKADQRTEGILQAELTKARPNYGLLMEEGGAVTGRDGEHRWLVDPIDGTTNFIHGIPHFAMSIALERSGMIIAGVIYNPISNDLFTAERGRGAFLNDRRLRVAARRSLSDDARAQAPCLVARSTPTILRSCTPVPRSPGDTMRHQASIRQGRAS